MQLEIIDQVQKPSNENYRSKFYAKREKCLTLLEEVLNKRPKNNIASQIKEQLLSTEFSIKSETLEKLHHTLRKKLQKINCSENECDEGITRK